MKRKVVNPNPQEKKVQKLEDKISENDMKEQIIISEELMENERENHHE